MTTRLDSKVSFYASSGFAIAFSIGIVLLSKVPLVFLLMSLSGLVFCALTTLTDAKALGRVWLACGVGLTFLLLAAIVVGFAKLERTSSPHGVKRIGLYHVVSG